MDINYIEYFVILVKEKSIFFFFDRKLNATNYSHPILMKII